jgi:hypothetical protein
MIAGLMTGSWDFPGSSRWQVFLAQMFFART